MYMVEKEVDEQNWGVSKAWSAVWWCGAQSAVKPGFGPSQQVAEMWNAKAKTDMTRLGELKTHQAVVIALERCVQSWSVFEAWGGELQTAEVFPHEPS